MKNPAVRSRCHDGTPAALSTRTARHSRGTRSPMMKNSIALLVTAATSLLTGCSLYFGDGNNRGDGDGSWTYCGSDGYYECQDEDCVWRGAECPSGTDPGGFECKVNEDCAAGCYCGNGICEE